MVDTPYTQDSKQERVVMVDRSTVESLCKVAGSIALAREEARKLVDQNKITHQEYEKIRDYIEFNVFGVCTLLGEKFGIASSRIRLWFIYISFLTFGSPVIIYMILAFWINMKEYITFGKRNPLRNW